jgi:hypothetical protein
VESGTKPAACDVCAVSWLALFWRLGTLEGAGDFTVGYWVSVWLRDTAAAAGLAYLLLWGTRCAQAHWGTLDLSEPVEYRPPEG